MKFIVLTDWETDNAIVLNVNCIVAIYELSEYDEEKDDWMSEEHYQRLKSRRSALLINDKYSEDDITVKESWNEIMDRITYAKEN